MSMLLGIVLSLALMVVLVYKPKEYEEPDDWPDEDWAKTFEEIRDDR